METAPVSKVSTSDISSHLNTRRLPEFTIPHRNLSFSICPLIKEGIVSIQVW